MMTIYVSVSLLIIVLLVCRGIAILDFQGRSAWEIKFLSSAYFFSRNVIFCI